MSFDFVYKFGIDADIDAAQKKIKVIDKELASKDFKIAAKFPDMDTSKLQGSLDKLKATGAELMTMNVKKGSILSPDGSKMEAFTAATYKYRDALGNVVTQTDKLDTSLADIKKKVTTFDGLAKSADTAAFSAKNMEKKHREAIEGTASALKEAITKWKELVNAGKGAGEEAKALEKKIEQLNRAHKESVGAAKTSANAMQDWSVRVKNAIKQSVAYTIALRALRQGMTEINKGIDFVIDLDTEMNKIRLLQVEGAKTREEVERLGKSYNVLAQEMGVSTLEVARGSVEWLLIRSL